MQVATEKMRYFKLTKANGQNRQCRFLPFVQSLSKVSDPSSFPSAASIAALNNPEMNMSIFPHLDAMAHSQSENFPDNSHNQCNLCVTGLDESLTSEDLHAMFEKFGPVKSVKVATDP